MVRDTRGISLTEVMITIFILGLVFALGPSLMTQLSRLFILNRTRSELQRETRTTMNMLLLDLRQSSSKTIYIDRLDADQPYYSRVSLKLSDGTQVEYYQNGRLFIRKTTPPGGGGSGTLTLTDSLKLFVICQPQSDSHNYFRLGLTLEKGIYEGKYKSIHMASDSVFTPNG